jgi:hypothetical protein
MAKVDADRDRDRRELARRKLGLFFRLGFSLNQVLGEATKARAKTKTKVFEKEREFELTEIAIATPPEIAEAWSFLDLLPRKVIPELHVIRIMLREIVRTIESAPPGDAVENQHVW